MSGRAARASLDYLCRSFNGAVTRYTARFPSHNGDLPEIESLVREVAEMLQIASRSDDLLDEFARLLLVKARGLETLLDRLGPRSDPDLAQAHRAVFEMRNLAVHGQTRYVPVHEQAGSAIRPARRTRCASGLAVRLLPPADRARYREEFAAELADLPRVDQAPHAIRLVGRSWSLRRSLTGRGRPASTLVIVAAGVGSSAYAAAIGWPTVVLGGAVIAAVMWTISRPDRTRHLASLIRAARSRPGATRKK